MTTYKNNIPIIEGAKGKGGGGGGGAPKEDPNTLASRATVRLLEVLSEGEILGLSSGDGESIYFNDTPLLNADGSLNFENAKYDLRFGLPSQTVIPGFSNVETEVVVGAPVTAAASVTRTVSSANIKGIRLTIQFPEGLTEQVIDGSSSTLKGSSVTLAVDTKLTSSGSWTQAKTFTVTGKTVSAYEFSPERIERPVGTGTWDIRVRRTTADATSALVRNKTTWARFTEIIDQEETYDNTALIGLAVDAESTGGAVPVRSYTIKGIKCQVPNNYNPTTHTYSGEWLGVFQTEWTDNPAWVLYDLLTNDRYGMGEFITPDMIDKYSFYDAGVYCDESVNDGFGSTEPRFTFNGVIQARDDAIKVLQAVASCMRATLYWYGGLLRINQDRPGSSVQMVRKEDVLDGKFTYQSSALIQRNTVANVQFNDKRDKWLPRITVEANDNGVALYGYNQVEVAAFGCTSEGQARRLGMWQVYTNLIQRESCTWKASFNQQTLILGDIVTIHDDDYGVERDFRIMSIKLEEANIVSIEAVLYDPNKYNYCDNVDNIDPPIIGGPGTGVVGPVTNVAWSSHEQVFEDVTSYFLQCAWGAPATGFATRYTFEWRKDNGNFTKVDTTTPAVIIDNVTPGTFEARIVAYNNAGVFSPVVQSTYVFTIDGTGGGTPPTPGSSGIGTPTNLQVVGGGTVFPTTDCAFEWRAPNPIGTGTFTGALKNFEVKIVDPSTLAVLRTVNVAGVGAGEKQQYIYTQAMNVADGGMRRALRVEVRCRDTKDVTGPSAIAVFTNPSPAGITNIQCVASLKGFFITFTWPSENDFVGVYLWGSTNANFALGASTLLVDGQTNFIKWEPVGGTIPNTTYYFRLAGYDVISKPVDGVGLNVSPVFSCQSSYEVVVTTGSVLPTTGNYEGRLFYLTTDGKLYRYHNGAWTVAVPTVDLIGQLTSAQIADIEAAKLTGQITTTQIANDAISTPKLAAGSVSTAKLAAGSVVADTIAANAVTAIKLAADSVSADKIAANSITSDKIMANAVTAGKLDAGIITADKMFVNNGVFGICVADQFWVEVGHMRELTVSSLQIFDNAVTVPVALEYYPNAYSTINTNPDGNPSLSTQVWQQYITNFNTGPVAMNAILSATIEFNPAVPTNTTYIRGLLMAAVFLNGTQVSAWRNIGYHLGVTYQEGTIHAKFSVPWSSTGQLMTIRVCEQEPNGTGTISTRAFITRVTGVVIGCKK